MYLIEWENIPRMTEDILDHARCRQIHAGQGRRVGYLFFFDYSYGQVTGSRSPKAESVVDHGPIPMTRVKKRPAHVSVSLIRWV